MITPRAKALEDHIGGGGLSYPFPEDDPEYGQHLASAWEDGYDAGLAARPPADVWVPVPLRWRHVVQGDVFVGQGSLWHVSRIGLEKGELTVDVYSGADEWRGPVDPDDVINVLVPVAERDAVELCREELGARLIAGRTV